MSEPLTSRLSARDIGALLADPSPASRAQLAQKLGSELQIKRLSDAERLIAEDIVRAMARDVAVQVRQAMAESLRGVPGIPRDIAWQMANDVDVVAGPILEICKTLTDDDLISIMKTGGPAKHIAIAGRETVSSAVADALIEKGSAEAVSVLVANKGAEISDEGLNKVVDRFGESELVQESLVHREALPIMVSERLVDMVSERLREHLVIHHNLSDDMANDVVLRSTESAIVNLVRESGGEEEVMRLVAQLYENGRLTASLLVRGLCMGDLLLFEAGLAVMAEIPIANARKLIHDKGPLSLWSLFEKAGLAVALLPPIRAALAVLSETGYDGGSADLERRRRRVIERVLTQCQDMGSENLDYLLNKLGDLIPSGELSENT